MIYGFYEILEKLIKDLGLENKPESIYNADESGFKSDPVSTKVVAGIEKRYMYITILYLSALEYTILDYFLKA